MNKLPFFFTIDTEGDNMWSKPQHITTKNVENLHLFQELCIKHHIKPIYLTNYEVSENKVFKEFAENYSQHLEIGLHLHAWNSPEIYKLTDNDYYHQPYLHEYPETVIVNKIEYLVKKLQDTFQTDIVSHRGGRYSINPFILDTLANNGIKIDCSVVPGFDWSSSIGNPKGQGGPDFTDYQRNQYRITPQIVELPVSTKPLNQNIPFVNGNNLFSKVIRKLLSQKKMVLRSSTDNLNELKQVVTWNLANNATHLEYIIHSSELVMGCSHLIKNEEENTKFYANLEQFFIYLSQQSIRSITFKDYLNEITDSY